VLGAAVRRLLEWSKLSKGSWVARLVQVLAAREVANRDKKKGGCRQEWLDHTVGDSPILSTQGVCCVCVLGEGGRWEERDGLKRW
jgi:hypothetical protein